ncbi:MAG: hypothetical protein ACE5FN_00715 [Leptospirillia bacterium]
MSDREESLTQKQNLSELFSALKRVVAGNPRLQEMIRMQEKDNRQVLLNMSSLLRMVEQEQADPADVAPEAQYEPKVVSGWVMHDDEDTSAEPREAASTDEPVETASTKGRKSNFFDRAFLKSLKISP